MLRKWDTGTNIRSCTYHTGYKLFIFRAVWNKNVVFAASAVELGSALKTFEKFEKWNSNFAQKRLKPLSTFAAFMWPQAH